MDEKDQLSWQDTLREFLEQVSPTYALISAYQLLDHLEELPEGVYATSDGPIEVNRSVH